MVLIPIEFDNINVSLYNVFVRPSSRISKLAAFKAFLLVKPATVLKLFSRRQKHKKLSLLIMSHFFNDKVTLQLFSIRSLAVNSQLPINRLVLVYISYIPYRTVVIGSAVV